MLSHSDAETNSVRLLVSGLINTHLIGVTGKSRRERSNVENEGDKVIIFNRQNPHRTDLNRTRNTHNLNWIQIVKTSTERFLLCCDTHIGARIIVTQMK